MGGGSLMTPILVFLFGIPPSTAIGTDIAHGAVFKSVGAVQHRRMGNVRARLAGWMLIGSIPASLLGRLAERAADRALRRRGEVGDGAGARCGLALRGSRLDREERRSDRRACRRPGLGADETRQGRRHRDRAPRRLHRRADVSRQRRVLRPHAARRLPASCAQGCRDRHLPRGDPALRRRRRPLGGWEHRLRDPVLAPAGVDTRRADRRSADLVVPRGTTPACSSPAFSVSPGSSS